MKTEKARKLIGDTKLVGDRKINTIGFGWERLISSPPVSQVHVAWGKFISSTIMA